MIIVVRRIAFPSITVEYLREKIKKNWMVWIFIIAPWWFFYKLVFKTIYQ